MPKIYESPDGGNTIYAREHGEIDRVEHRFNGLSYSTPLQELTEAQLWSKIRKAAETDSALHSALERVKILYYLSMENGNNT